MALGDRLRKLVGLRPVQPVRPGYIRVQYIRWNRHIPPGTTIDVPPACAEELIRAGIVKRSRGRLRAPAQCRPDLVAAEDDIQAREILDRVKGERVWMPDSNSTPSDGYSATWRRDPRTGRWS